MKHKLLSEGFIAAVCRDRHVNILVGLVVAASTAASTLTVLMARILP